MIAEKQNYLRFVAGMLCGELAYHIQSITIAWYIFSIHHAPLDLGLIGLALFLPTFLFVFPAGECSDRFDRRRIVMLSQVAEAICVIVLLAFTYVHLSVLALYLALLTCIGTARAFGSPAERTLLPTIVSSERYMAAKAQYAAYRSLIVIIGPALGGILVAISTAVAFGMCIAMLIISTVLLYTLTFRPIARERRNVSLSGAFDGLRFIVSQPVVAGAISLDLFAVLFGGATALLPAFADGIFRLGPTGLGILRSAPALGAALMAAFLAYRPPGRGIGKTLLIAVAIFGIATIVFGLSKNIALSLLALILIGASDMVSVVIRNGLVQLTTPDAMRGRVTAFENIFIGASNELGAFESGMLASFLGVVPSVVLGGIGTLAVIAVWSAAFPSLRRADSLVEAGI